jgi:hypothetical protein
MLRRAAVVVGASAVMMGGAAIAEARSSVHPAADKRTRHTLTETVIQTSLSSSGSRSINVGILDGKIGGKSVHGTVRAIATFSGPGMGTGNRTEFDQYGSRTASLTFKLVTNPDGSRTDTGSGHWTGGTGLYTGATGSFSFKGTLPAGSSTLTAVFKGTIVY